jgi:glucuronoarabinoxylan endo-1,4-beta-xylanase
MKEDGRISKLGYCMAQYAKFIRPGYHGVDATKNPTNDVYVSAYRGERDVVIVAVNGNTSSKSLTLSSSGADISSYDQFTTSGGKSLAKDGTVPASNGSLSVTLDAQSVTPLHGARESSPGRS